MAVKWSTLTDDATAAVIDLTQRCLAVDGGLPITATSGFVSRRYQGENVLAIGAFDNGALVASGTVRPARERSIIVGQVHPQWRGRGLGADLLDRLLGHARQRQGQVHVETEALTSKAAKLFRSRQLVQTFAEYVMSLGVQQPLPSVAFPDGVEIEPWAETNQGAFFDAYRGSFADRPGVPD